MCLALETHFAIKRYFHTVVRRVEQTFRNAHNDAKDWLETALDPLTAQPIFRFPRQ